MKNGIVFAFVSGLAIISDAAIAQSEEEASVGFVPHESDLIPPKVPGKPELDPGMIENAVAWAYRVCGRNHPEVFCYPRLEEAIAEADLAHVYNERRLTCVNRLRQSGFTVEEGPALAAHDKQSGPGGLYLKCYTERTRRPATSATQTASTAAEPVDIGEISVEGPPLPLVIPILEPVEVSVSWKFLIQGGFRISEEAVGWYVAPTVWLPAWESRDAGLLVGMHSFTSKKREVINMLHFGLHVGLGYVWWRTDERDYLKYVETSAAFGLGYGLGFNPDIQGHMQSQQTSVDVGVRLHLIWIISLELKAGVYNDNVSPIMLTDGTVIPSEMGQMWHLTPVIDIRAP